MDARGEQRLVTGKVVVAAAHPAHGDASLELPAAVRSSPVASAGAAARLKCPSRLLCAALDTLARAVLPRRSTGIRGLLL